MNPLVELRQAQHQIEASKMTVYRMGTEILKNNKISGGSRTSDALKKTDLLDRADRQLKNALKNIQKVLSAQLEEGTQTMRFTHQDPPPENAEVFERLKIQRIDSNSTGKPLVKIWRGKQSKPFIFYSFPNKEKRDKNIQFKC